MGMIDLRRRLIDRMPHKKTAEGAVASFSTDVKAPLKVLLTLKPIQAGSGDPAPDNVRAISGHDSATIMHHGGNLLKGKFSSGKSGSVTFTVNDDGSVSTDGTSTSTAVLRSDGISVDEGGTYKLYGCPHGGDNSTYRLDVRDSDGNIINTLPYDIGNGANITIPSGTTTIKIGIRIASGNNTNGLLFKPVLSKTTEVYASHTATFDSTVYAGEVDWNAGKVKATQAIVDFDTLTWVDTTAGGHAVFRATINNMLNHGSSRNTSGVCDHYPMKTTAEDISCFFYEKAFYVRDDNYADAAAFSSAIQNQGYHVVYDLATPVEYDLSDLDAIMPLMGTNNIWADNADEISVEYWGR